MTQVDNTVVRKTKRVTNSKAKSLVADGLQAALKNGDIEELALAGGCSTRAIQKALAHETLLHFDTLLNALDYEPAILAPALAAKGYTLTPVDSNAVTDMELVTGLTDCVADYLHRIADGERCHVDTAILAQNFRKLIPHMQAIVDQDNVQRGVVELPVKGKVA